MEAELRNLSALAAAGGSAEALKEKEALIEQMSREIRELTNQRDLAQSRIHNFPSSGSWTELSSVSSPDKAQWLDDYAASEVSECVYPFRPDGASTVSQSGRYEGLNSDKLGEQIPEPPEDQYLCDDTSPRLFIEKYFGPDPCKGWENIAQRLFKIWKITARKFNVLKWILTQRVQALINIHHLERDIRSLVSMT